ncbi:MAG: hypothetical protein KatS3mg077_3086 [Candidatus Binatia bacterium]|nr:MAG: hypothetical protein KatS3mg077_3086 [Candidatus Binatia bacterium]
MKAAATWSLKYGHTTFLADGRNHRAVRARYTHVDYARTQFSENALVDLPHVVGNGHSAVLVSVERQHNRVGPSKQALFKCRLSDSSATNVAQVFSKQCRSHVQDEKNQNRTADLTAPLRSPTHTRRTHSACLIASWVRLVNSNSALPQRNSRTLVSTVYFSLPKRVRACFPTKRNPKIAWMRWPS